MASGPGPPLRAVQGRGEGGVLPKMRPSRTPSRRAAQRQKERFLAEMEPDPNSQRPDRREAAWMAYNQTMKLAEAPGQP